MAGTGCTGSFAGDGWEHPFFVSIAVPILTAFCAAA
jgi:hypothetical protein